MDWNTFYSNLEKNEKKEAPKHKDSLVQSRKEIDLADHLMFVTFPLINDLKFLVTILEHVVSASKTAVQACLEYEKYYKRIDPFPTNFAVMVDIFNKKCKERYNIEDKFTSLLKRLIELSAFMSKSQIQFRRQDKFIMTSDVYDIKTLDKDTVKKYLLITKSFIDKVESITQEETNG